MILIVSVRGDLHARAIQHAVVDSGYADVHLLECDRISGRETLSWRSAPEATATVLTADDQRISVEDLDVIWWRRVNADQEAAEHAGTDHERALVNHDCRGALSGMLATEFHGEWISHPTATSRAADKIFQLAVAARAGFRIPRTLVSQSREEVLAFAREVGRIIVKPVVGAPGPLMFTQYLDDTSTIADASFTTSPAIYQEYIEGERHVRLNCFGSDLQAALIETSALDWRPDLNVPISPWGVPADLRARVAEVLDRLDLRMGIIDLKLTPEGEPVWLEVNPQGQFLFLEPLLGMPLAERFAEFLIARAGG